jgi:arylsulfatase/arylsulfatase A
MLVENGKEVAMKGYCTDIYFDAAMDFIAKQNSAKKSFFTYIATNAPHGPFHDVPQELYEMYKKVDFSPILIGAPKGKRREQLDDKLARICAMITNIDENVGRLFKKLEALEILDNTIVIYLNDNGPNTMRYVGNMRGMKTGVDDGGIRSPLLFHWPAQVKAGQASDRLCAHIDILPTLLDACGVSVPAQHKLDGRSFLPLLTGASAEWAERSVVFQTHRGDEPQLYHHFALHQDPWKLVHPSGFGRERFEGDAKLQLYNVRKDPRQQKDLAGAQPEVFKRLQEAYEAWFEDVSATRPDNYAPPRIIVGTAHEPQTVLTRQDWRHSDGRPWAADSNGAWLLEAPEAGEYDVELILPTGLPAGTATLSVGDRVFHLQLAANQRRGHRTVATLPAGKFSLRVELTFGVKVQGPHQVILTRVQR